MEQQLTDCWMQYLIERQMRLTKTRALLQLNIAVNLRLDEVKRAAKASNKRAIHYHCFVFFRIYNSSRFKLKMCILAISWPFRDLFNIHHILLPAFAHPLKWWRFFRLYLSRRLNRRTLISSIIQTYLGAKKWCASRFSQSQEIVCTWVKCGC